MFNFIIGTNFDDNDIDSPALIGTSSDDLIIGKKGDDYICAGDGNNIVFGGDGDDTIFGGNRDFLHGGDGNDLIFTRNTLNQADPDPEGSFVFGGSGNDLIIDMAGDDYIDGGSDIDIIVFSYILSETNADGNLTLKDIDGTGAFVNFSNTEVDLTAKPYADFMETITTTTRYFYDKTVESFVVEANSAKHVTMTDGVDTLYQDSLVNVEVAIGCHVNDVLIGGNDDEFFASIDGVDIVDGGKGVDTIMFSLAYGSDPFSATMANDNPGYFSSGSGDVKSLTAAPIQGDFQGVLQSLADQMAQYDNLTYKYDADGEWEVTGVIVDLSSNLAKNVNELTNVDEQNFNLGLDRDGNPVPVDIEDKSANYGMALNIADPGPYVESGSNPPVGSLAVDYIMNIENIVGGMYDDVLIGDKGDNEITGLLGNDLLIGGKGEDVFIFGEDPEISPIFFLWGLEQEGGPIGPNPEVDTILDFNMKDDTLLLQEGVTMSGVSQTEDGTTVHLSTGNMVTLAGITATMDELSLVTIEA